MNIIKRIIGILKINTGIAFITIFSTLTSCKGKHEEDINFQQKIVEDNFLQIVDTFAYKFGTFRPLLPEPNHQADENSYSKLFVYLDKTVTNDKFIHDEVKSYFKNTKLNNNFVELINLEQYSNFTFNSEFSKQIGKYFISFDSINPSKIQYAGKVVIKNFKILEDVGYFVVELSNGDKSEIGFIVVIKKINDKWVIVKREPLYQS